MEPGVERFGKNREGIRHTSHGQFADGVDLEGSANVGRNSTGCLRDDAEEALKHETDDSIPNSVHRFADADCFASHSL